MLIEKARRLGHGYRNVDNERLRMLLAANGTRTRRPNEAEMTTLKSSHKGLLCQRMAALRLARSLRLR
jgi:hypothetical protein